MATRTLDYFASLVSEDVGLPLTEAALSLALDAYPDLDMQTTLAEIDQMSLQLKRRIPDDTPPVLKLRLLHQYFYRELGFNLNQNDYHHPDNSYLNTVLKTRRGIPITLAVLYMEIAHHIGLPVRGISFPMHFLMRLTIPAGEIIIDPANGHTLSKTVLQDMLDPYLQQQGYVDELAVPLSAFLRVASPRDILVRMLLNLKAIYLPSERWERLLNVQQRLVILQPDRAEEIRDRGLAYANLECFRYAAEDLEAYLQACPDAADAPDLRERLLTLRQMSRTLN